MLKKIISNTPNLSIALMSCLMILGFMFVMILVSIIGIYYIPIFEWWVTLAIVFGILFFISFCISFIISIYFFINRDKFFINNEKNLKSNIKIE